MESQKPNLVNIESAEEFARWYWLKAELVDFCREKKLKVSGNKQILKQRIKAFLQTGEKAAESEVSYSPSRSQSSHGSSDRSNSRSGPKSSSKSKFDWKNATLTRQTKITDSYKNNRNVRQFMESQTGRPFRFSIAFMQWMKENEGKTLQDALNYWYQLQQDKKRPDYESTIPPGNEYNQYVRDFMKDNPGKTLKHARHCWAYKTSMPGSNRYHPQDIENTQSK
ncbi:MAG: DUF6434 domain-containing protein [Cyanobacteria bacterium J06650_10]